jgi:hypothetical protein
MSTVLAEGGESRQFHIEEGVRQGDPLSCILFNIFINDLAKKVCACTVDTPIRVSQADVRMLLFADDVAIPANSLKDLEAVLKVIEEHSDKWRWKANIGKSNLMRVPGRGNKKNRGEEVVVAEGEKGNKGGLDGWLRQGMSSQVSSVVQSSRSEVCSPVSRSTQGWSPKRKLMLYGKPLKWVEDYTYLGIIFNSSMSWQQHIDRVCPQMVPCSD